MNLNGVFNLKLLWEDIYQLWNEIIEKACLIVVNFWFFEIRWLKS